MKQVFEKFYMSDAWVVVAMIVLYNVFFVFSGHFFEHINALKIIWVFIGGAISFIPMYLIIRLVLRKLKSELLFFFVSLGVWLFYPILQILNNNPNSNLTYRVGDKAIYLNGDLTLYGYLYKLQTPFLFLALYSTIILGLHLYRSFRQKTERTEL